MKFLKLNIVSCLSIYILASITFANTKYSIPEINYDVFTLDNGLTVIVHEDRKVPMVAVNVWYHVGSKNEKTGKTGFAHLFEHLMFNGTENYNSEYFEPFEKIGSTDQNGTTNSDRTNYFQNVPTNAIDLALWMESDRMGHLLGVVDQEKLDEQRGVVQNEKRQGENQPYGKTFLKIAEGAFPKGHPYSWSTIGYMEDLDAATLDDVKEWFKTYYGPNNAVLVLAGDIDLNTAKIKVNKYFGDIPPGPPLFKNDKWIAKRNEEKREILYDNVPQTRIYKVWNTPSSNTIEEIHFDLAASVLSDQKNSPLYKDLVYKKQIATGASAFYYGREIAGLFIIAADVAPGENPHEVEQELDRVLQEFLDKGPNEDLLHAEKTKSYAAYIRGIQRIGGFGGKSDILATCYTYTKNPSCYKDYLINLLQANAIDVKKTLNNWIDASAYVLTIEPEGKYSSNNSNVDRSQGIPYPNEKVAFEFPKIKKTNLNNGSELIVASRHDVPIVELVISFDSGNSQEELSQLGYTNFMMDMLNEGTASYSSLEFDKEINKLGSNVFYGSSLDSSTIRISTLKTNLDQTISLVKESLLNPTFPQAEIDRIKKLTLASIEQEENRPRSIAYREIGKILYGTDHPYGKPLTGSGTSESISNINRNEIIKVYKKTINPNLLNIVVVGDISLPDAKQVLNKHFGRWESRNTPKKKKLFTVSLPKERSVFLINKPNAVQSYIVAGQLIPPSATKDEILIDYMNYAIGGSFTSRLNMNLREDKSWSYGVRNRIGSSIGQRSFLVNAPVQTDKTVDSVKEIIREFDMYMSNKPITVEELSKAKAARTLRLPGQYETLGALLSGVSNIVKYDRKFTYLDDLPKLLDKPSRNEVIKTAEKYIKTDQWVWLIVGDLDQIEEGIRKLNLGKIIIIE